MNKMKIKNTYSAWTISVIIILYTLFIIGVYYSFFSARGIINGNNPNLILLIIVCIISLPLFVFAIPRIYRSIDYLAEKSDNKGSDSKVFSPSCFIKYSAIIFLSWSPYIIISYPGTSIGFDYFWQLMQGIGIFPLSNHHPVFSSMLFGWLYSIGYKIGGSEVGLFFTVVVQSLALSMSIGLCISVLKQLKIPKAIVVIMLVFFCLCPIFPTHATWLVKDTFFSAVSVFLFTIVYVRIISIHYSKRIPYISSYPVIVLTAVIFSAMRNGITIIAVLLVLLISVAAKSNVLNDPDNRKKEIRASLISMILIIVIMFGWSSFLNHKNVCPTNIRETLSIPMRQIMYTVKEKPDKISDKEKKVLRSLYIDNISQGDTLDGIASKYSDKNADPLKISYSVKKSEMKKLVSIWFSICKKNPVTFIDALFRGTIAYWWPAVKPSYIAHPTPCGFIEDDFANKRIQTPNLDAFFLPLVKSLEYNNINTNQTMASYINGNEKATGLFKAKTHFKKQKNSSKNILHRLKNIPLFSILYSPGLYFWITVICLGYFFSRKLDGKYLFPVLLFSAMAMLSPINGYVRYVLQFDILSVLLIGICFVRLSNTKED